MLQRGKEGGERWQMRRAFARFERIIGHSICRSSAKRSNSATKRFRLLAQGLKRWCVASIASKRSVGATALTTPHFLLLYAAMLVAAAGNTALQSVMPAIGREIGIADLWVALAYTWSAVLWVLLAPYWAAKSDRHGRKALTLVGLSGFVVSTLLCGIVLHLGLIGAIGAVILVRPGHDHRASDRAIVRAARRRLVGTAACLLPHRTSCTGGRVP